MDDDTDELSLFMKTVEKDNSNHHEYESVREKRKRLSESILRRKTSCPLPDEELSNGERLKSEASTSDQDYDSDRAFVPNNRKASLLEQAAELRKSEANVF